MMRSLLNWSRIVEPSSKMFEKLVAAGNPVGEIIGIDSFMVSIRGLQPANVHATVRFDDDTRGYVHQVLEDHVVVMKLDPSPLHIGAVCVVEARDIMIPVGKNFIGRVVNVFGEPLDGKGAIAADQEWDVFHSAPMLYERELLDTPVETGVTILDLEYSLARGQRMAMLGDSKVGKTALAAQVAINQKNTDITVIYVLIAKRQHDVAELVSNLEKNDALKKAVVVVSNSFESLILTYLVPYVGAAHGEYFWHQLNMDTLVIYDDLTAHAQAYREISLIAGVSPGRDSYPGDMFYTHSSLLERGGKTESNHASQTLIPIVYAPGGDITAYLPTNIMSITDGQWILDEKIFKDTMRPAVSTALSVTRVGGVGQNKRQKGFADKLNLTLAGYRTAEEYAHFGTELSPDSQAMYDKGKVLFQLMNQGIGEIYSFVEQQFIMSIVLNSTPEEIINVKVLKEKVRDYAAKLQEDKDMAGNFDELEAALKAEVTTIDEVKKKAIEKAAKIELEKRRQTEEAETAAAADATAAAAESAKSDDTDKKGKK
ncbi:sodium-transporting two-sector ATPase [bacterium]|nr:MAG: sodium-transporting two-sector ATPase [bacterium]